MIIFEKVQSMHQTQSPQQRYMNVNDWKLWQGINTILYKQTKIMHLKAIERGKTFLTGAPHKTDLTSITQQCFIILGREGPTPSSLIFVFYTTAVALTNTIHRAFEKYKTAG